MFKCLTHQCIHGIKWNVIGCFACQSFGLLGRHWPFKAAKVPRPSDWQQKYCLYCLYSIFSADTSVLYFCVCLYRVLSLASVNVLLTDFLIVFGFMRSLQKTNQYATVPARWAKVSAPKCDGSPGKHPICQIASLPLNVTYGKSHRKIAA